MHSVYPSCYQNAQTLDYIALHYITLDYIALKHYIIYIYYIYYITLWYFATCTVSMCSGPLPKELQKLCSQNMRILSLTPNSCEIILYLSRDAGIIMQIYDETTSTSTMAISSILM